MSAVDEKDAQQIRAQDLMLKGVVSEMSPEDQAEINRICGEIKAIVEAGGDLGFIAYTLVGATLVGSL